MLHEFPSTMAQNFWIAILAWSACFVVTIAVSLATLNLLFW
jgi:solute:Na+ symporter, SSS family